MEADANYEQVTMDMSEVWISTTLIYYWLMSVKDLSYF